MEPDAVLAVAPAALGSSGNSQEETVELVERVALGCSADWVELSVATTSLVLRDSAGLTEASVAWATLQTATAFVADLMEECVSEKPLNEPALLKHKRCVKMKQN